jgi:autotransporter passenger strand-loop-strand repeat protein
MAVDPDLSLVSVVGPTGTTLTPTLVPVSDEEYNITAQPGQTISINFSIPGLGVGSYTVALITPRGVFVSPNEPVSENTPLTFVASTPGSQPVSLTGVYPELYFGSANNPDGTPVFPTASPAGDGQYEITFTEPSNIYQIDLIYEVSEDAPDIETNRGDYIGDAGDIIITAGTPLFTTASDTVNFSNLTTAQQSAIAAGAETTNGLGGGDTVTLNAANSTFQTNSGVGQATSVTASDNGNYNVTLGQGDDSVTINGGGTSTVAGTSGSYSIDFGGSGNETVTINGNGNSTIVGNAGSDTITIIGTGNSDFFVGTGTDTLSISGGGELSVSGQLNGSATIGSNSTLELENGASGGSITFNGSAGTLKIDGTAMPTDVISGFVVGDAIDLAGFNLTSLNGATLTKNGSTLTLSTASGQTYSLQFSSSSFPADFAIVNDGSDGVKLVAYDVSFLGRSDAGYILDLFQAILSSVNAIKVGTEGIENFEGIFNPVFAALGATAAAFTAYNKFEVSLIQAGNSQAAIDAAADALADDAIGIVEKFVLQGLFVAAGVAAGAAAGTVLLGIAPAGAVAALALTLGIGGVDILAAPAIIGTATGFVAGAFESYYNDTWLNAVTNWIDNQLGAPSSPPTIINNQSTTTINLGQTETGIVITPGGVLDVSTGGTASGVVIASGGVENLHGTDIGTIVGDGGTQYVYGTASNSVLLDPGTQFVESGGITNNPTINGGILKLTAGSSVTGSITFGSTNGGLLQIAGTVMPTAPIVGFSLGDKIDLAGLTLTQSVTLQLLAGNVLQVAESGATYDLHLDPTANYAGVWFALSSDGNGGTDISIASISPFSNHFYLLNSLSGPELKDGGTPVTAGEFGAITPIAAVQTASGYDVAWQIPGTNQFTFWTTDSNGNYTSNISGLVSGTSATVESLETTFNQDLNGDGTIGAPTTVVQTDGATSLAEGGNNYFLYFAGTSSGPALNYAGAPVTPGEFGNIAPVGAVQTATGYDIAWKVPGTNEFTFWAVDSNGNYISNITGLVSGTSFAVESLETIFGQDLNGDGTIGPTTSLIQTDGSTSLTQVANEYFLYAAGGTSGPALSYGGAPVTVGEFGSIAPIGAEKTANGYDLVWKVPGADQYTIWNVDSNGNYISNATGLVSGSSFAIESLETTLGQDLNGDGTIGVASSLIQQDGSTSLLQIANNYYLYVDGVGPELKYGGAPVTVGEFGAITPIGALQTSGGYEFVWKIPGSDQYTVWNIDSNGNYISNAVGLVSGSSFAIESLETSFHQDLNGDGTIGVTASLIQTDGSTSLLQIADNYYAYVNGVGPELKYGGSAVTVGEFGNIAPIGAIQTATGYDIAWQTPGSSQFTFWAVDGNGNYESNLTGLIAGTDPTLKSLEATFYQDFNGDGVIDTPTTVIDATGHVVLSLNSLAQPSVIETGATLELRGSDTGSITFNGATGTLVLDHSSTFTGEIFGLTGTGSPASSDEIDLRDIAFVSGTTTESYSGNASGGMLTVRDAQNDTAHIALSGNYTDSTFTLTSDGEGGTIVIDPPATQAGSRADAFHFKDVIANPAAANVAEPMAMVGGSTNESWVFHSTSDSYHPHGVGPAETTISQEWAPSVGLIAQGVAHADSFAHVAGLEAFLPPPDVQHQSGFLIL